MTNAGLPRSDATWCIAILGIANTISKWTCGFLCNKKYLKTYSMYAWSHILSGLVSCMIVFANSSKSFIRDFIFKVSESDGKSPGVGL